MRSSTVVALAAAVVIAGSVSSCAGRPATQTTRPAVVASTDVWGSVARTVAGEDAEVTSIVSGPVDPHSFTPAPAAVAEIADAAVVIYNGGGYDAWMTEVLGNNPKAPTVDAYSLLDPAAVGESSPANEHVFYELGTAKAVATRIADRLAEVDSAHADQYRSRAAEFGRNADKIRERERALRISSPDTAVVATEPVAHYLLLAAGLRDETPQGFSNAVEQDTDPAPADIAAMLDLITKHQVSALVFNDQTVTGATRQIRDAATTAGVPVVTVTETLPDGKDYLSWQADTVDRLTAALGAPR
ncbi:MAG TPA: zinc ABC transporter substrate-binding protein [Mycobacterium sp.]|uniref:metal ABC transporter solute-binding protein, Zn/Mn family n=1 Tax=Mycolicibacterium sp. TaxID=2320850 RepID=UPI0025EA9253|nr:zinc ABC transporter substrate-binding protein [Mycolicibacterium sp.]HPX37097.1 zinc ABC transporter substrate-binding protein [Mycobacterium sp.]HQC77522.1 zinc ABC transporter substrate-binding protein [Mycobacterium sp.]